MAGMEWQAIYVIGAGIVGCAVAVGVWIAAICQSGIVKGGSIGIIPAFVGGLVSAATWPLVVLVALLSEGIRDWAVGQFEPR